MSGQTTNKIPRDLAPLERILDRIEFALELGAGQMDGISAENLAHDALELARRLKDAHEAITTALSELGCVPDNSASNEFYGRNARYYVHRAAAALAALPGTAGSE